MSRQCHPTLIYLHNIFSKDVKNFGLLQTGLAGFASTTVEVSEKNEENNKEGEKEPEGRKRWKRMVADLHDGVGDYCIEVYRF